jgi:hypothetical protein
MLAPLNDGHVSLIAKQVGSQKTLHAREEAQILAGIHQPAADQAVIPNDREDFSRQWF